jgi:iron complex transport system substrate-binding protein
MQIRSFRNSLSGLIALIAMIVLPLAGCRQQKQEPVKPADAAPRIVSLAPSMTEMLFAIGAGDQLVGRTSACDWPAEVKEIPIVGAFGRPSLEILASIKPDIVVDVDLDGNQTGDRITSLGIRREHIRCLTPDDVPSALRTLGRLSGHLRKADSIATTIENGLAEYRKESAAKSKKTKIYLEIWDDPLWTGGKHSFTSAMVSYAGGYNIGDAVEKEYFEVSPEWVIMQDPEIIACMYMSKGNASEEKVRNRTGWAGIDAVRHGRVYGNFDNNIFLRPGPRILEGIAGLKKLLETQE